MPDVFSLLLENEVIVYVVGGVALSSLGLFWRSIRRNRQKLKPIQRPSREPYNPDTFRR